MLLNELYAAPKKWLLLEYKEGKNTHLEHLEDLVFHEGNYGASLAVKYVDGVRQMLNQGGQSHESITVKWDGAPAIFAGIDPEDGQFFVGTKSVFNKSPKLIKSIADISAQGYEGGLASKLKIAFTYLSKLGIGTVLQGDMMYTTDDLEIKTFNGKKYIMFQPNTITYAVPEDSDLGKRIKRSKMGIIFHTEYTGETLADMTASFGAGVSGLNHIEDVWFDDASYKDLTGVASLTPQENAKLESDIAATKKAIKAAKFDALKGEYSQLFMTFVNSRIRQGDEQVADPQEFAKGFSEWYAEKIHKEIAKLKNQDPEAKPVQNRLKKIEEQNEFMKRNFKGIIAGLMVYKDLIALKTQILNKLNKIDSIKSLVKTDDGYKVVNPEGFVAIGDAGGAVKFVDRLSFSRMNFTIQKNWAKT